MSREISRISLYFQNNYCFNYLCKLLHSLLHFSSVFYLQLAATKHGDSEDYFAD